VGAGRLKNVSFTKILSYWHFSAFFILAKGMAIIKKQSDII
jgi:hypothetical protein